ncbi:ThiF family adenylyltransferase [Pararhizobium sp. LjRoot235]|uniref:ThiF family adenylyltransferase n=1 Tax=Pararhizobium sp. LjRoot235 TaxID=3342291 RepID=UPI003ED01715
MWQPDGSEIIDPSAVAIPLAAATVRYLRESCQDFASVQECRRFPNDGMEIVTFELRVEVPQRPVYDIRDCETVSVCFVTGRASAPAVAVAREDFPDTPHQNIVPEGFPSMLCIDDRPWQDVRSGYTASELVARISQWFAKAGQGELHGDDQPFDPFFGYSSPHQVILTSDGIAAMDAGQKLNVWTADKTGRFLLITSANADGFHQQVINVHVVQVDVEPQQMKRIRRAPRRLPDLVALLMDRDPTFVDRLKTTVEDWFEGGKRDDDAKWVFCVLARFPQIHPRTGVIGATKPMAFLAEVSPGQIGVALGVLDRNDSSHSADVRYLRSLFPKTNIDSLSNFEAQVAQVHTEMDADAAARITGHEAADKRRAVLIGAGSLGSVMAELLTREGFFEWTVVDDDALLPHNLSRHVLNRRHFGLLKAPCVAERLLAIRSDVAPKAIVENTLGEVISDGLASALDGAELIIDASASVPVSRFLSDREGNARRVCAFFTPDGGSAVLMIEAADRNTTLRDIEAVYLREVLINPSLETHFAAGQQMRYTGACRALTSKIPTSRVGVLAALIASGISKGMGSPEPSLRIWTVDEDDAVEAIRLSPDVSTRRMGEWKVLCPESLRGELASRRAAALPNETGGPLLGLIDFEAKVITAVHAPTPPADSIGKPYSFVRGTIGLRKMIETAEQRSGGQVRYLGEWHSHPQGASAAPSAIDVGQIYDLSLISNIDGFPAISFIVSENDIGMMVGSVR